MRVQMADARSVLCRASPRPSRRLSHSRSGMMTTVII